MHHSEIITQHKVSLLPCRNLKGHLLPYEDLSLTKCFFFCTNVTKKQCCFAFIPGSSEEARSLPWPQQQEATAKPNNYSAKKIEFSGKEDRELMGFCIDTLME